MRIQILELPTEAVGEQYTTPFALIVDQVETVEVSTLGRQVVRSEHPDMSAVRRFAEQVGASGVLFTDQTVEVA